MKTRPIPTAIIAAAEKMDWQQVQLNGEAPCFHICEDGSFCGRAERWHIWKMGADHRHHFVPFMEMIMWLAADAQSAELWENDACAVANALGVKTTMVEAETFIDEACERIAVFKHIATELVAWDGDCRCEDAKGDCIVCLARKITKNNPAKTEDDHLIKDFLSRHETPTQQPPIMSDCEGEGCGKCDVCNYLKRIEDAQSVAPPGSLIPLDSQMEEYLASKYPKK